MFVDVFFAGGAGGQDYQIWVQVVQADAGGEQVALLLQALENFQYESLSLGLEKQADGSAKATLSILGKNPDVLDGHPFAVNIDLSGNFDSLFETAMDAYRLSDRAIRATVQ